MLPNHNWLYVLYVMAMTWAPPQAVPHAVASTPAVDTQKTRVHPRNMEVVDGDTIKVSGVTYRLMGYDTPETYRARCNEEKLLGELAADYLADVIRETRFHELEIHGRDRYGRHLAILYVDGIDVSKIMIRGTHAIPYHGGKRVDWCNLIPVNPDAKTSTK